MCVWFHVWSHHKPTAGPGDWLVQNIVISLPPAHLTRSPFDPCENILLRDLPAVQLSNCKLYKNRQKSWSNLPPNLISVKIAVLTHSSYRRIIYHTTTIGVCLVDIVAETFKLTLFIFFKICDMGVYCILKQAVLSCSKLIENTTSSRSNIRLGLPFTSSQGIPIISFRNKCSFY